MKKHKHHVLPKHKGGSDDEWNLEEIDFIAHAEIHARRYLEGLDRQFDYRHEGWRYLSSDLREAVRAEHSRRFQKEGNPNYQGKSYSPVSPEKKEAASLRMRKDNPMKKPEIAKKVSEAKKGKPSSRKGATLSEETKEKLRKANLGKKWSEEAKSKLSESRKGKKRGPYKKWSEEDKKAQSERMKLVRKRVKESG